MKKIGLISDVHGNLQALQVALSYLKQQNVDEIIHTGDVVDIGADSLSCLQLLLQNNVLCLMGNHDKDFVENSWQHKHLSHVSARHKKYVFNSLRGYQNTVSQFPLYVERLLGGKRVIFEHYCRFEPTMQHYPADQPYHDKYIFRAIINPPTAEGFDDMHADYNCDVVFFGHKHEPCDIVGDRLYVDVGSVGCHPEPLAMGIIVEYDDTHFNYSRFALPYDQSATQNAMTNGTLPDGAYLFDFYYLHKKMPNPFED